VISERKGIKNLIKDTNDKMHIFISKIRHIAAL
jgi:hypothetical protein